MPYSKSSVVQLVTGRRMLRWRAAIVVAVFAALIGACAAPSQSADSSKARPRVVSSAYGPVTITGSIHRVVALSADWLGTMLAVGAPVVGYRTDGPASTMAAAPWLQNTLPDSAVRLTGELDIARIAALRPDLIVAPTWLVTRAINDRLAELAPIVVGDDSGVGTRSGSWERDLATAGTALGRDVGPVRDSLDNQIRATAAAHPDAAGKSFAIGVAGGGGQLAVTSSPDASTAKFLGALGLHLVDIPGATGLRTVLSAENARVLDSAYLLIMGSTTATSATVRAFTAGRPPTSPTLEADLPLLNAFNIPDASSIPVLLRHLDDVLPT